MIPKTLSATSLNVAELCMARWEAEMFKRGKGFSANNAATLGSSVHGALEMYVKQCVMETTWPATVETLLMFFKMSYCKEFGTADTDTEEYADGLDMLRKWHARTDFTGVEVVSVEVKTHFDIATSAGPIPFNYIWDRFDKIGEFEYKVVDYKTNRWGINPNDLRKKVQARAYALAAMIQLKNEGKRVDRVWVEFDMLRHDGPVGIVFSREDNAAMWRYLKESAERIIATEEGKAPETLNAECNFCPRKVSCGALQRNISIGGIARISTAQEAIDLRAALEWQGKAVTNAIKELDSIILAQAREEDVFEFESDMNRMRIGVSSRRQVDADRVSLVIGPQLFDKYGGKSFTMANYDKLLKGDEIDDQQKSQLRGLLYKKQGEPSVKVEPKNSIDE